MGVENAVRLAQGFAAHGFSSVIEGLETACHPGTGWSEQAFGPLRVYTVALLCAEAVVIQRWQARGWGNQLPPEVLTELQWYQTHAVLFNCVVDTTSIPPEQSAKLIVQQCWQRRAAE